MRWGASKSSWGKIKAPAQPRQMSPALNLSPAPTASPTEVRTGSRAISSCQTRQGWVREIKGTPCIPGFSLLHPSSPASSTNLIWEEREAGGGTDGSKPDSPEARQTAEGGLERVEGGLG